MAYLEDQALFEGKLHYGQLMELSDYIMEDYVRAQYGPPQPAPLVYPPAPVSKRRRSNS